jgi:hypothetical protein
MRDEFLRTAKRDERSADAVGNTAALFMMKDKKRADDERVGFVS